MEYCNQKNNEAIYFFNRMKNLQEKGKLIEFTYNLSAFLTAARSITAYVRDNAKKKDQSKIENLTKSDNRIDFLRKQRNITVHRSNLQMSAATNFDISTEITVNIREDIQIEKLGNEVNESKIVTETEPKLFGLTADDDQENINITHQFYFKEWKGNEDILGLCSYYLTWINAFMTKMRDRGYIG